MGQDLSNAIDNNSEEAALPVATPPDLLTLNEFQDALPKGVRGLTLTQKMLDRVNQLTTDPDFREYYRENLIGYTHILQEGTFSIEKYLDAVKYVSYKVMGSTNVDAYRKTFPDRMQNLVDSGKTDKDISAYVAAYNKGKLVNLILEQTLVPSHVLNADLYQKAINQQAYLMMNANSEKVQQDAANSLLTHLKPPETTKIDLNVGVKQDSAIDALRDATEALVAQQRQAIQAGTQTAKDAAHSLIIEVEGEVVDKK